MDSNNQALFSEIAVEEQISFVVINLETQEAHEYTADGDIIERDKREVLTAIRALERQKIL